MSINTTNKPLEERDGRRVLCLILSGNAPSKLRRSIIPIQPKSVNTQKGFIFTDNVVVKLHSGITPRGAGKSTGRATLTGFAEVKDVIAVCRWLVQEFEVDRILLVGSSAGKVSMRSAVEQVEQVVGYVSLGYPFGLLASVLFGRHHKAILSSLKPKLFVMGTRDGFTSVSQLKKKLKSAAGSTETHLIEGVSHFQMEGPEYDSQMADVICNFISSL
ncbi:BnaC02g08880D [Brassica napus]|uniref:BnaC02g08880D protein n=1 Tax=Brassica napus TaxID=3708 RepID=A0A078HWU2_BRANA|nr:BnaC02g08880D [Brassica napus]